MPSLETPKPVETPNETSPLLDWCDWLIVKAQTIDFRVWEPFVEAVEREHAHQEETVEKAMGRA